MIRLRLLAALTGLGALVVCPSVSAFVEPEPVRDASPGARDTTAALGLLETAAAAARTRSWTATQHVTATSGGTPRTTVMHVSHVPGWGSQLGVPSGAGLLAADVLDASLLSVLAERYDLRVVAPDRCDGRVARVVEARRPGITGHGQVAGRFWLDTASGLVLRRDVVGTDGALLRSSWLGDLRIDAGPGPDTLETTEQALRPHGERLSSGALDALAAQGWPVTHVLPGGLELYDARMLPDDVLQLSYSDGLFTLSLFGQRGELPPTTTGVRRTVAGGTVWEWPEEPRRIVWSEHGHTWTLLSDAPSDVVEDTLEALPHGSSAMAQDGIGPRVWRGMARVGGWLNPFD